MYILVKFSRLTQKHTDLFTDNALEMRVGLSGIGFKQNHRSFLDKMANWSVSLNFHSETKNTKLSLHFATRTLTQKT